MSAEGTPHEHLSLLGRLLVGITWLVLRFPVVTVVIGVLAAIASLYLSQTRLGFRTSRADLLNPKSEFNRLWVEYTKEFGATEDVIVVVEGAGQEKVIPVIDELAADLFRETRLWNTVLHKIDLTKIRCQGTVLFKARRTGRHRAISRQIFSPDPRQLGTDEFGQHVRRNGANVAVSSALHKCKMPKPRRKKQAIEQDIASFFDSLVVALSERGRYQSPWPDMYRANGSGSTDCPIPVGQGRPDGFHSVAIRRRRKQGKLYRQ